MAMLLRMTGVSSMVINQWHTSVENNVTRTNAMIKGTQASIALVVVN